MAAGSHIPVCLLTTSQHPLPSIYSFSLSSVAATSVQLLQRLSRHGECWGLCLMIRCMPLGKNVLEMRPEDI